MFLLGGARTAATAAIPIFPQASRKLEAFCSHRGEDQVAAGSAWVYDRHGDVVYSYGRHGALTVESALPERALR